MFYGMCGPHTRPMFLSSWQGVHSSSLFSELDGKLDDTRAPHVAQ